MSDQLKTTEGDKQAHRTGVSASVVAVLLLLVAAFGAVHYLIPSAIAGQSGDSDNSPAIVESQHAADPVDRMGANAPVLADPVAVETTPGSGGGDQSLKRQLFDISFELDEASSEYGPGHPKVKQLQRRKQFLSEFMERQSQPINEPATSQQPTPGPAAIELTGPTETPTEDVRSVRLKLDEALKRYGPNHSRVLSLRKRLLQMEEPISGQPRQDDLFGSVSDPARQRFDAEQRRFQAQIDRLKRRVAELERKLHQRAENRDAIIRRRRQPGDVPSRAPKQSELPGQATTPEEDFAFPAIDSDVDAPSRPSNVQPKPSETFNVPSAEAKSTGSFPSLNIQSSGTVVGPPNGEPGMGSRGRVDRATEVQPGVSFSRPTLDAQLQPYHSAPVRSAPALDEPLIANEALELTEKASLSDILCARMKSARKQSQELQGKQVRTADDEERLAGADTEIKVLAQQIAQQHSLVLQQVEQTKTTVKRMQDAMKSLKQAGFSDALAEQRMNARIKSLQKRTADLQEEAQRLASAGEILDERRSDSFKDDFSDFDKPATESEPESLPEPPSDDFRLPSPENRSP